ncbi:unnamed protein product [Cochlearia groenlandica]
MDNLHLCDIDVEEEEEDYIDMEVTSFASLVQKNLNKQNPREFEFQMSHLCPLEIDKTTSPADELFYKGTLLPLHLPPRFQMLQKLLQDYTFDTEEEYYCTPLATGTVNTPTTSNTPFESCTASPVKSCHASQELNPKDYFLEYSNSMEEEEDEIKNQSWIKKVRLIKKLSFGTKIKASRAYLSSFFGKSSCSDESSCASSAAKIADERSVLRYSRVKKPLGQIKGENPKKQSNGSVSRSHRRSFSVSMRRKPSKISDNKSSSSGLGFSSINFLKKSSNLEVENSIQGAILHCKESLQQKQKCCVDEVGFCSLSSGSRISVRDDQERAKLFRG